MFNEKVLQKRSIMGPNGPKVSQNASKMPPDGPKWSPNGSKWIPNGPNLAPRGPKWSPNGAKRVPKWSQNGTRGAPERATAPRRCHKSVPRPLRDRFWTTFGSDFDGFSTDFESFWLKRLTIVLYIWVSKRIPN